MYVWNPCIEQESFILVRETVGNPLMPNRRSRYIPSSVRHVFHVSCMIGSLFLMLQLKLLVNKESACAVNQPFISYKTWHFDGCTEDSIHKINKITTVFRWGLSLWKLGVVIPKRQPITIYSDYFDDLNIDFPGARAQYYTRYITLFYNFALNIDTPNGLLRVIKYSRKL